MSEHATARRRQPLRARTEPLRARTERAPRADVLVVDGVSKSFGDVVAVSDVSFTIGNGVTALLGPNGAGKSTMLRLLCGLTMPSRGTVRVLGGDPRRDLPLRGRIGLVPQQEAMFEAQTALEFVTTAGALHLLDDPVAAARHALTIVELDPDDRRRVGTYSKGMRQRVRVAQAIVHDPPVLVLDEPLTGLDPRQRRLLIDLFHGLGDQNRCVLVSSHVLDEVERFGSRVLVLVQGRLAATGDFRAIRDLMDDRPHRIRIRTDDPRGLGASLLADGLVLGVQVVDEGTMIVDTDEAVGLRRSVAGAARALDARLHEIAPLDDDLESVFKYLVGT